MAATLIDTAMFRGVVGTDQRRASDLGPSDVAVDRVRFAGAARR